MHRFLTYFFQNISAIMNRSIIKISEATSLKTSYDYDYKLKVNMAKLKKKMINLIVMTGNKANIYKQSC